MDLLGFLGRGGSEWEMRQERLRNLRAHRHCCPSSTYLVVCCLLCISHQVAAEPHRFRPGHPGLDRCHPGQVWRMKTPGVGPAGAPTPAPSQHPPEFTIQHISKPFLLCVSSVDEQISRGTDLGRGSQLLGRGPE